MVHRRFKRAGSKNAPTPVVSENYMFAFPLRTAALTVAAAIGLSACATPYGYGGVSVGSGYGYGYGGGYNDYYDPYYSYGYNDPRYSRSSYYGWNDGFYYPGTGYYVYDR